MAEISERMPKMTKNIPLNPRTPLASWIAATITVLVLSSSASARTPFEVGYTKTQVYSAALRYLRVDLGQDVYEKDPDSAYLLFHFVADGAERQKSDGSIEIISAKAGCRVVVQLPKLPSYFEQTLRESLVAKLRGDYGAPDAAKPEAPKTPKKPEKSPDLAQKPKTESASE